MDLPSLSNWLTSAVIVVATFSCAYLARAVLARLSKNQLVREVGPAVSNLVYVIGLYLFIEAAPLAPRLSLWLGNIAYIIAILVVLWIARHVTLVAIEWGTSRSIASPTMRQSFMPLMRNSITLFVIFIGAIIILKHFEYDVVSLITTLGVSSLAVGFAAKDTLSNMISGFTLILDRNLHTGDRISLGEFTGVVDEIGLRTTRLRMDSGNTLIVPNGELANTKILNLSMPNLSKMCRATVRVSADHAFSRMQTTLMDVVTQLGGADRNRPRSVELVGVGDGLQTLAVNFWIQRSGEEEKTISEFNQKLLDRLANEGIRLQTSTFTKV